jgi:hypothetical protein
MFTAADFDTEVERALLDALGRCLSGKEIENPSVVNALIRALGAARSEAAKPLLARALELEKRTKRPPSPRDLDWYTSTTWNAMRASARIYTSSDIQSCIDLCLQRKTASGLPVRVETLTYIRQPEITEFLIPFLDYADPPPPAEPGCAPPRSARAIAAGCIAEMHPDVYLDIAEYEARTGVELYGHDRVDFIRDWIRVPENRARLHR